MQTVKAYKKAQRKYYRDIKKERLAIPGQYHSYPVPMYPSDIEGSSDESEEESVSILVENFKKATEELESTKAELKGVKAELEALKLDQNLVLEDNLRHTKQLEILVGAHEIAQKFCDKNCPAQKELHTRLKAIDDSIKNDMGYSTSYGKKISPVSTYLGGLVNPTKVRNASNSSHSSIPHFLEGEELEKHLRESDLEVYRNRKTFSQFCR